MGTAKGEIKFFVGVPGMPHTTSTRSAACPKTAKTVLPGFGGLPPTLRCRCADMLICPTWIWGLAWLTGTKWEGRYTSVHQRVLCAFFFHILFYGG